MPPLLISITLIVANLLTVSRTNQKNAMTEVIRGIISGIMTNDLLTLQLTLSQYEV